MKITDAFDLAARTALRKQDERTFYVGAVGVRTDGKIVCSSNVLTKDRDPECHAEARLARKLDFGATVFVARISRAGVFRLARPCPSCARRLKAKGVRRVYYTIGPGEHGVQEP